MLSPTAPACRGFLFHRTFVREAAALLCVAAVWWVAACCADAAELKEWRIPAPPVALRSLDGGTIDLASLRGRVVIVHFFATWCEPCREELPALQRFVARAGDKPVAVVAISVGEVELRVRRFFQSSPVAFPVLLDPDRVAAKAWGISALPSTVILDAELRPRLAVEGEHGWDQLDPAALYDMIHPETSNRGSRT